MSSYELSIGYVAQLKNAPSETDIDNIQYGKTFTCVIGDNEYKCEYMVNDSRTLVFCILKLNKNECLKVLGEIDSTQFPFPIVGKPKWVYCYWYNGTDCPLWEMTLSEFEKA